MKRAIVAFLLSLYALDGFSNVLYRYKDANGGTVLGVTVPPELQKNGYEVLNQKGRVIEVIPPAPTAEEIAERKRLEKLAEEKAAREAAQKKADEELVKIFLEPDTAIRAYTREVNEIKAQIKLQLGKIETAEKHLSEIETQAADRERSGQPVTERQLQQMSDIDQQIKQHQSEIDDMQAKITAISEDYLKKIDRLQLITGKEATLPLPETEVLEQ